MRLASLLDDFARRGYSVNGTENLIGNRDIFTTASCYDLSSLANVIVEPWDEVVEVSVRPTPSEIGINPFADAIDEGIDNVQELRDVLVRGVRLFPRSKHEWYELGNCGCLVDSAIEDSYEGSPVVGFLPTWRDPTGRCRIMPFGISVDLDDEGYGAEARLSKISIENESETTYRVIAPERIWKFVRLVVLVMGMLADGIAITERVGRPARWVKRYEKRNGAPPIERYEIQLIAPLRLSKSERHVALHYTRPHDKFYSGEKGHRFFGQTTPRKVQTPGFWSGNPDLGISLDISQG